MLNGLRTKGFVPPDELESIAQRNRVQVVLHGYVSKRHAYIFRKKAARKKDYVVVFIEPERMQVFMEEMQNGKKNKEEPRIKFFAQKEEALPLLGQNPHSVLAWRYSPKLQLMY
jgi:hypothetical protein